MISAAQLVLVAAGGLVLPRAVPTPTPSATAAVTGPGVVGFLVTIALVAVCIPLFVSMARKIRGVRFRDGLGGGDDAAADGTAEGTAEGTAKGTAEGTGDQR